MFNSNQRRLKTNYLLSALAIIGIVFSCWSGVRDYSKKVFDANKDFFGVFVYSIIQDANGFLWISSNDGLYRFDGHEMLNLNDQDTTMNALVTASNLTRDGHLLIGYYDGGLSIVEHSRYRKIIPEDSLNNKINRIVETPTGDIWVLTQNLGLARVHNGQPKFYHQDQFKEVIAKDMAIIDNTVYVATNNGLLLFELNRSTADLSYVGKMEGSEYLDILSLMKRQNTLWLGTGEGIKTIDLNLKMSAQSLLSWPYLQDYKITALSFDQLGDLWIGTRNNGLFEVERPLTDPAFTKFDESNGFESNEISKIFVDAENEVWVGTFGDGLVQLNRANFHHYALKRYFNINAINAITSLNEDDLVLATNKGLIRAYKKDLSDSLNFENLGLLDGIITTSLFRQESKLWIGTLNQGVFIYEGGKLSKFDIPDLDININQQIRQITEDQEDHIWISVAGNGVYQFHADGTLLQHFNTRNGFYHNEVYFIHADTNGNIWFAAHGAGLAILDKTGEFQLLSRDGVLNVRNINTIKQDKSGLTWIGTSGRGIYSYDGQEFRQYTQLDGLLSDFCNSIIFDLNDNVWVAHRTGLSLIQKEYGLIRVFNHPEELGETESIVNSNYQDDQGNLWIGNPYGVTKVILPHINHTIKNRNTHIVDMRFYYEQEDLLQFTEKDKIDNILPQKMEFPHDNNHITFDYVAINLKDPEAMYYRYKLEGYEEEWSPISSSISATYTNLDPGTYTFHVKESDHKKYWDDQFASITFRIDDPFWEKWWFYLLQLVFIAGIIVATYTSMGRVDNPVATRLMVYISLFMLFEYIHTEFEPYLDDFAGEIPIFQVIINLMLALILFPVEKFVMDKYTRRKREASKKVRANEEAST